ncbi:MAG: hypothetical protein JWM76_1575 [Pseudonocardiales bacterium]|nr:hypothetical protein [Pseudonocardiales bacterium]
MATADWFGVRCLFASAVSDSSSEVNYEERITIWPAEGIEEAIVLAEIEAEEYATVIGVDYLGFAQAYAIADRIERGAEVFSLIRHSNLEPSDYVKAFFNTGDEHTN